MRIAIHLFIVAMFSFVASCRVSRDIPAPALQLPDTYRGAANADTANIALVPRERFFTNELLRQLIDSALVHNPDMQTALRNREIAQLLVKQSRLGYLPSANLQAAAAINRPSDNSLTGLSLSQFLGKSYVEDYTMGLTLSWEADIWGKIKSRQTMATAEYLQTDEARKAIQTDLVANIARGYYRLLMLDEQLDIARRNIVLTDSVIAIIRLQYAAGQVTALAVQQAEAQRLVAAELVPALERAVMLEENYLSVLSGVPPATIARKGSIHDPVYDQEITAGVPAALLSNRPDVKARELDIVIAGANKAIAKAAMYPSLNISVAGGVNAFLASNWFSLPASLFANAVAGVGQPLFQQGKLKTQYRVTEVAREKAVIAFRKAVLEAVGEVSDALAKLAKLQEQQLIAQQRVLTLQQSIGNARMLFANGMANYLEVITAQANVLQGELSLAALQQQQAHAVIELYRAVGGM